MRIRFRAVGLALAVIGLLAVGSPVVASADSLAANAPSQVSGEQPAAAPIPADCGGNVVGPANNGAGVVFATLSAFCDFVPSFFVLSGTLRTDLGPVDIRGAACGGSTSCLVVLQAPCSPGARYQVVAELAYVRPDGTSARFVNTFPPGVGVQLC